MLKLDFKFKRKVNLNDFFNPQLIDVRSAVAQLFQHFVSMLTQQGRARHHSLAIRHFDRVTHGEVFASRRMINLNYRAGFAQRGLF